MLVLLCLDAAAAVRDLAAGTLACPSCTQGRLARWGHGTERVIRRGCAWTGPGWLNWLRSLLAAAGNATMTSG